MQGNVYASDICHPKGTSIRARCLVAVHPPALLCFSPLRLLEVATICATSYLRSVCSHRGTLLGAESSSCPKMWCGGFLHDHGGALLGKTVRECAVVVVSAVTRAHYLAGILMLAMKCAAMTTTLAHELEGPQRTCGTSPPRQHYRCRNHFSASFL